MARYRRLYETEHHPIPTPEISTGTECRRDLHTRGLPTEGHSRRHLLQEAWCRACMVIVPVAEDYCIQVAESLMAQPGKHDSIGKVESTRIGGPDIKHRGVVPGLDDRTQALSHIQHV